MNRLDLALYSFLQLPVGCDLFGEPLNVGMFAGLALILAAVWLVLQQH